MNTRRRTNVPPASTEAKKRLAPGAQPPDPIRERSKEGEVYVPTTRDRLVHAFSGAAHPQAGASSGVIRPPTTRNRLLSSLQAKANGSAPPNRVNGGADAHEIAERGLSGAGQELPHADRIQRAFGRHDVSAVKAHVGGGAAVASRQLGAEAYATGDRVAFDRPPSLHTAAHEAAHVVQQRAGVHLKGGMGEEGDAYERQADAVADAVVAGR